MNQPVVKGALARCHAGDMAPPARHALYDRDIRRNVPAFKKSHPEVTWRIMPLVVGSRLQHAAADAHALEIDDRLGEHRKAWRLNAVRAGIKILAQCDRELVVDPPLRRIPKPSIAIFRRNVGVGLDVSEILQAPRIGFTNWHRFHRSA